jgi:hypothetical protein
MSHRPANPRRPASTIAEGLITSPRYPGVKFAAIDANSSHLILSHV